MEPKSKRSTARSKIWNSLPWRKVSLQDTDLGDFEEAILYDLEEVDGNEYILQKDDSGYKLTAKALTSSEISTPSSKRDKKLTATKLKKLRQPKDFNISDPIKVPSTTIQWGNMQLNTLLYDALINLGFSSPTPIQSEAIPHALISSNDVVGAAETGSGKTLAFVLPIIHYILQFAATSTFDPTRRAATALIIAPTRELALQITKVIKDICEHFKAYIPISVVPIVGGMSEQKQRRMLGPHSRPPDVIVGTPGRLCEISQDEDIAAFKDLSTLRFLVVDEADRIVEEGHFPELHRLFSRIRDHETMASQGLNPADVESERRRGVFDDDFFGSNQSKSNNDFPARCVGERRKSEGETRLGEIQIYRTVGTDFKTENVNEVEEKIQNDNRDDDDDDDELEYVVDEVPLDPFNDGIDFEPMPTEAEIEIARKTVSIDEYKAAARDIIGDEGAAVTLYVDDDEPLSPFHNDIDFEPVPTEAEKTRAEKDITYREHEERKHNMTQVLKQLNQPRIVISTQRQTFLFSATAICTLSLSNSKYCTNKKEYRKRKRSGNERNNEALKNLPPHLQELLSMVAAQDNIKLVDVTGIARAMKEATKSEDTITNSSITEQPTASNKIKKNKCDSGDTTLRSTKTSEEKASNEAITTASSAPSQTPLSLPKGLTQYELRAPLGDKDTLLYLFLIRNPGRSLVFVNSIKTARRVDGLLRALELNCRTIHAQLQQRQRLRALESYATSVDGILVATDVAARGLDISKIKHVIHYDVSRSPQVYVHRSGRTARAGEQGMTLSLVSPEDMPHHAAICAAQGMKLLPLYKAELHLLPKLSERVDLAKKIFTQSFVLSQSSKANSWLQATAEEADLEIDDNMIDEIGDEEERQLKSTKAKKMVDQARKKLKRLLNSPLESFGSGDAFLGSKCQVKRTKHNNTKKVFVPESYRRRGLVVVAK